MQRYFSEYITVDPGNNHDVAFIRAALSQRKRERYDHERATCSGVQIVSESIKLRQEEGQWRVVSDLVLSYPDPVPAGG